MIESVLHEKVANIIHKCGYLINHKGFHKHEDIYYETSIATSILDYDLIIRYYEKNERIYIELSHSKKKNEHYSIKLRDAFINEGFSVDVKIRNNISMDFVCSYIAEKLIYDEDLKRLLNSVDDILERF